jgi:hypothetical protein
VRLRGEFNCAVATSRYLRANEFNLCFVLIIDRDEKTA